MPLEPSGIARLIVDPIDHILDWIMKLGLASFADLIVVQPLLLILVLYLLQQIPFDGFPLLLDGTVV